MADRSFTELTDDELGQIAGGTPVVYPGYRSPWSPDPQPEIEVGAVYMSQTGSYGKVLSVTDGVVEVALGTAQGNNMNGFCKSLDVTKTYAEEDFFYFYSPHAKWPGSVWID